MERIQVETRGGATTALVEDLAGVEEARQLPAAGELFDRHGGNVRDALRELYDVCAGRIMESPASSSGEALACWPGPLR